jgi:hypothetical protein
LFASLQIWVNPGTEQIESYLANIERRFRKAIREFEARQAARSASKVITKRSPVRPQAA